MSLWSITLNKGERILAMALSAVFLLSILSCFSLSVEVQQNNTTSEQDICGKLTEDKHQRPVDGDSFSRATRSNEEDYIRLISEIGHGSNVGYENSITSGDVDNDGVVEILFTNEDGYVHVVQYQDGDYVDEWRSPHLDWEPYGLAVGDTDSDGTPEIVVGNHYGEIYIFGYQGPGVGYVMEWEHQLNKEEAFGIAIGNLDGDEYQEIVVGALQLVSTEENVFVFGYDGSTYVEEYRYLMTDFLNYAHAVVIYDVDSDGTKEFVVGTQEFKMSTQTPRGTFYVFGHNGNDYTVEWKRPDISDWVGDLDCGDVDDDDTPEIVVSGATVSIYQYESGVYLIENNIAEEHPKLQVGDVNHDGQIEIVTGYWELKVWQENTLLWESETFEQEIYSVAIVDSDSDQENEILFTKGVIDWYSDIYVLGYDGSSFIEEWVSEYLPSISSISIEDVNSDGINDLVLGTRPGELIIFEDPKNQLKVRDAKRIEVGFEIIHVFCGNFDGDSSIDIVATDAHDMIYFLEYDGADYVKVDEIQIVDDSFTAAEVDDVDSDGKIELVMATLNGYVYIIGYEGSYEIEWSNLICENGITAITTGNSDNDGVLEILVGGFDYYLYVLVYDGSEYVEIRTQHMSSMIFTLGVGDIDYDGENELVSEVGYFELKVFQWNGTYYVLEWSTTFYEDAHNEAMDINHIESNNKEIIAFGTFELYVIGHGTDYEIFFESETYTVTVQCLFMGDVDESGTNEIFVSIGSYVFIYGKEQWLFASLKPSKTSADVDEEIVFDGSFSKGPGTLEYFFDYGDGTDSGWTTESVTTHRYSNTGTYTASLKIRDQFGNESTNIAEVSITILEPNIAPTAFIDGISPNPAYEGDSVSFSGHGQDEDGFITDYIWISDINGELNSLDSFSLSSLSVGTHTISFRVMDDRETWSDYVNKTLVIDPMVPDDNQIPRAYISSVSPKRGFEGEEITFTGYGIDDDGNITSYSWESDIDGILSNKDTFGTSFLSVGTHMISFKVKDDNDAWSEPDTATLIIDPEIQNRVPEAFIDFVAPNPATAGEIVTFQGHGVDEDGIITSYSWESDIDGDLGSKRSFSTSTLSVGEHIITLKVQDDKEAWSESESITLEVKDKDDKGTSDTGDSNGLLQTLVFLGILTFAIIFTIILVFTLSKKKSGTGSETMSCPNCASFFRVPSSSRPIAVLCPICDENIVLYD
ncbi:MAG: VCBS repeat-containing protein [Thermoplasmata archaeon]|nr:MAG: VCBS repeat-containing protein [Thermoplasmata archaeon]